MGEGTSFAIGRTVVTGAAVAALVGTGCLLLLRDKNARKAAKPCLKTCGRNVCAAFENQCHKLSEVNSGLRREMEALLATAKEVESKAAASAGESNAQTEAGPSLEEQNKQLRLELDELRAAAALREKGMAEEHAQITTAHDLMREQLSEMERKVSLKDAESGALRNQNLKLATDVGQMQARLIHATKLVSMSGSGQLLRVPAPGEEVHSETASQASEISNMSDVKSRDPAKISANKAKFDQMKQQRNAYRDQLKQAIAEVTNLRREVASLRAFQAKYYVQ
uniref:Uncharacterized protein n=1 Tax=Pyramimonas obovata TaxID=1411642 RepID=A0A7S0MVZ0_9CHLO|mmetsp:Transcript_1369/g.2747  ORF Transcript_1369/g.2747 Transcript_1369/m.2747 type:complete len:281 (+) Transcript_1369:253-1095(+)